MTDQKISNKHSNGVCKKCLKQSDRLVTPPLISPPDWHEIGTVGDEARWILDGEQVLYNLAFHEGVMYLRPYTSPNDPICWDCFSKCLQGIDWVYVVNLPDKVTVFPTAAVWSTE